MPGGLMCAKLSLKKKCNVRRALPAILLLAGLMLSLPNHIYGQDIERNSNSIEVLVARLRRRIGQDVIKTKRGFGYYVEADN